jgi:hypothetical protein
MAKVPVVGPGSRKMGRPVLTKLPAASLDLLMPRLGERTRQRDAMPRPPECQPTDGHREPAPCAPAGRVSAVPAGCATSHQHLMRCSRGCGGRVLAAWLETGPVGSISVSDPAGCRCWGQRRGDSWWAVTALWQRRMLRVTS